MTGPEVVLVTYSTRPRGGVVHTLALAEALHRLGEPVHLMALGDPEAGFFRAVEVPYTIVPAPPPAPSLEARVFRSLDALAGGLAALEPSFRILHAQDCISARAATRVRDLGEPSVVVRTVHHVDDFTTPAIVECQRQAILEPDHLIVVSDHWRRVLRRDYGVAADVVRNGVDLERFSRSPASGRQALRARVGAERRPLFLTVGGIEPRKGSADLIEAMGELRRTLTPPPVLAVVGGHSFQDYAAYRERVFARAEDLGLELGSDVVLLGTVGDDEAMASGLPVVATDIPVFHEYLLAGQDALMVPPGQPTLLADAMRRLTTDAELRTRLRLAGSRVAGRFRWDDTARIHRTVYGRLAQRWATRLAH